MRFTADDLGVLKPWAVALATVSEVRSEHHGNWAGARETT
ncbi:hypothetical protein SPW_5813 [Streptomyces sp. W007]|nr:hypothetical protein SPW_5813 [Streptomyces sp. W007]